MLIRRCLNLFLVICLELSFVDQSVIAAESGDHYSFVHPSVHHIYFLVTSFCAARLRPPFDLVLCKVTYHSSPMERFKRLQNCGVGLQSVGATYTRGAGSSPASAGGDLAGDSTALLRIDGIPQNVSTVHWDVILIDGPAG